MVGFVDFRSRRIWRYFRAINCSSISDLRGKNIVLWVSCEAKSTHAKYSKHKLETKTGKTSAKSCYAVKSFGKVPRPSFTWAPSIVQKQYSILDKNLNSKIKFKCTELYFQTNLLKLPFFLFGHSVLPAESVAKQAWFRTRFLIDK